MNRSSIYNGIPFKPGILSSISRSKLWTPSVKSPIKLDLLASHEKLVWNFGNQVPLLLGELKIYESNGNGTFAGSKTEPTLALNDYVWAAVAFKSFQKRITALKSQHRSSLKEKISFSFVFWMSAWSRSTMGIFFDERFHWIDRFLLFSRQNRNLWGEIKGLIILKNRDWSSFFWQDPFFLNQNQFRKILIRSSCQSFRAYPKIIRFESISKILSCPVNASIWALVQSYR